MASRLELPRPHLEARIRAALQADPPQMPVVVGASGSGRTSLLLRIQRSFGAGRCQYVNLERAVTTPERFMHAVCAPPLATGHPLFATVHTPREAFDAILVYLAEARAPGGEPATFLLDEILEIQMFESFPGLRHAMSDLFGRLATSTNRFVMTSRYQTRTARLLQGLRAPFVIIPTDPLSCSELEGWLPQALGRPLPASEVLEFARISDGRVAYLDALVGALTREDHPGDLVSALATLLAADGMLAHRLAHDYETRLHRTRGYGTLKGILEILADTEPLTLSTLARRLGRTPGSTRDYLTWLVDVDLVSVSGRQYRIRDPLLRLWVRLYCRPIPPDDTELANEVRQFALSRLAAAPAPSPVGQR